MMIPVTSTHWRKAAASSGNGNNCVEVGISSTSVGIRDTKNRHGGTLTVGHATFGALLTAIKNDRLH
ncbi:DUF397 domain-containing protein [Actinoalloteichus fjordicus]|nr:DUF397 domain-containing protein [Actinoalloteichus fjordicus]